MFRAYSSIIYLYLFLLCTGATLLAVHSFSLRWLLLLQLMDSRAWAHQLCCTLFVVIAMGFQAQGRTISWAPLEGPVWLAR